MKTKLHWRKLIRGLAVVLLAGLVGCDAAQVGSALSEVGTSGSVQISPEETRVRPEQQLTFSAWANGASAAAVAPTLVWSVEESNGGSITSTGLYTAPSAYGTYHVKVSVASSPSVTDSATVTVSSGVVVSLDASSVTLAPGAQRTFVATVSGTSNTAVTWRVQEASGCGSVTQGGVYTAPSAETICHVQATSSQDSGAVGTAVIVVSAQTAPVRRVGVDLGWVADWDPSSPFADVIKQGRPWGQPSSPNTAVATDSDGWPTVDASVFIFAPAMGAGFTGGPYKLTFNGQATLGGNNVKFSNQAYDAASNTTTADLTIPGTDNTWISFTQSKRTASSAAGTGVTNVRCLRPGHLPSDFVNKALLARLASFALIRPMQTMGPQGDGVMKNTDTTWASRVRPSTANWQKNGPAWEYIVLLANQSRKDVWITIPFFATTGSASDPADPQNPGQHDNYVRNVALLFRYGSNGVLPYTGPSGSAYDAVNNPRPAPASFDPLTGTYPPLDSDLHLYVEWSNELWNYNYPNTTDNQNLAKTEVNSGGDPNHLNYDNDNNAGDWAARRIVFLGIRSSLIWRSVFGDALMHYTGNGHVRPVLGVQTDWTGKTDYMVRYMTTVWGGTAGQVNAYGNVAHPSAYYFHALAIAPYCGLSTANKSPANLDQVFASMNQMLSGVGNGSQNLQQMIDYAANQAAQQGMKLATYEGGQDLQVDSTGLSNQAQGDARMETVTLDLLHYFYAKSTADLFTYYTLAGNTYYGLASDLSTDSTPKWNAVKAVAAGR